MPYFTGFFPEIPATTESLAESPIRADTCDTLALSDATIEAIILGFPWMWTTADFDIEESADSLETSSATGTRSETIALSAVMDVKETMALSAIVDFKETFALPAVEDLGPFISNSHFEKTNV